MREALALDPENSEAHRALGLLALRRGRRKSAEQAHRAALQIDPTDADVREGLAYALKSRNPMYRWLLRLQLWLASVPRWLRWLVMLSPFILSRVLPVFGSSTWVGALVLLVLVVPFLSWILEPLMTLTLLLSQDRHLVSRPARMAAHAFLVFAGSALTSGVLSATTGLLRLMVLAFGLGAWALATGSAHTVRPHLRKWLVAGAGLAAAATVVGVLFTVAGMDDAAVVAIAAVVGGGVVATWFTVIA